jgi:hypothetical protein
MIDHAYRHNAKDCAHGIFVARDDNGLGAGSPHVLGPSLRVFRPNAPIASAPPALKSSAIHGSCFGTSANQGNPMQCSAEWSKATQHRHSSGTNGCGTEKRGTHGLSRGIASRRQSRREFSRLFKQREGLMANHARPTRMRIMGGL